MFACVRCVYCACMFVVMCVTSAHLLACPCAMCEVNPLCAHAGVRVGWWWRGGSARVSMWSVRVRPSENGGREEGRDLLLQFGVARGGR